MSEPTKKSDTTQPAEGSVPPLTFGQIALLVGLTVLALVAIWNLRRSAQQSTDSGSTTLVAGDSAAARAAEDTARDKAREGAERADKEAREAIKKLAGGSSNAAALNAYTAAKMNLEATLKDGDSAKYRDLFVSKLDGGNLILCGEVNAKNAFGAYTGFKGFIAHPDPGIPPIIQDDASGAGGEAYSKLYAAAYQQFCTHLVERL